MDEEVASAAIIIGLVPKKLKNGRKIEKNGQRHGRYNEQPMGLIMLC